MPFNPELLLRLALTEPILHGVVTGFAAYVTFDDIKRLASEKRGYDDVPDVWQRVFLHIAQSQKLRQSITLEKLLGWWCAANPMVFRQVMADPTTAMWVQREWDEAMSRLPGAAYGAVP